MAPSSLNEMDIEWRAASRRRSSCESAAPSAAVSTSSSSAFLQGVNRRCEQKARNRRSGNGGATVGCDGCECSRLQPRGSEQVLRVTLPLRRTQQLLRHAATRDSVLAFWATFAVNVHTFATPPRTSTSRCSASGVPSAARTAARSCARAASVTDSASRRDMGGRGEGRGKRRESDR